MPYCARDLLAVDGMVLQSSLFLSSVTAGGRSVQGILIAIMMADPVHKRAVAPASSFRALSQSSRDTIWGRSMLLELSTLLLIRLLWFQPPSPALTLNSRLGMPKIDSGIRPQPNSRSHRFRNRSAGSCRESARNFWLIPFFAIGKREAVPATI